MKKIILIIIAISFFSCQKEKRLSLEGNWQFDTVVSYDKSKIGNPFIANEIASYFNFKIKNDSVIHFNEGFFDFISLEDTYSENQTHLRATYYLGTETKYFLKDSILVFYNKYNNKNDTIKLLKISQNELLIRSKEGVIFKLINKINNYFDDSKFDAIVVNRSPCFGICPFNFTYLDRKGNFYFKNLAYNTISSDISTKLDKNKTNALFSIIDKIDFIKHKDNYFRAVTDNQTNTISFFKNGKIIKTITTYADCPVDLKEAINEISYAYQNVPEENDYESILGNDETFGFQFKDKKLTLLPSEADFLEVELSRTKKVNIKFNEKFEIDPGYYENKGKYKKIFTDGRYYKFILKDNSSFVVDLGYNFIDKNPILKKNRIF